MCAKDSRWPRCAYARRASKVTVTRAFWSRKCRTYCELTSILYLVHSPWNNDSITNSYDELGRLQCLDIGGVAQSVTYDALGRATQSTNALGSFTNAYVDATLRLSTNCFPNGRQTLLSYHGTIDELALGEINWLSPRLGG